MARVHPLIHRFLEDPASLEEADLDRLVAMLRDDPRKASEVREQLLLSDYLSQKLAIDRQNFFAQIEQRIADFEQGEEEMYDQVAELRAIAEAEIDRPLRQPASTAWLKYALAAAICLLLAVGLIAWQFSGPAPRQVALIEELSGDVTIVRGRERSQPRLGKAIATGDRVVSTTGSTIRWQYTDGTTVRIVGAAKSLIAAEPRTGAKRVQLDQGELVASVSMQERGPMVFVTPHATATVRGTELRLVVGQADTQLDVVAGKVDLTRLADGQTIQVAANESGVASAERITLKLPQWPVDRSRAVYLFEGTGVQQLTRNPQTGNFRDTPLEFLGGAAPSLKQSLLLDGGRGVSDESGELITRMLANSGEFTLEFAFIPALAVDTAGGVLFSLGPPQAPSIELRQQGASLLGHAAAGGDELVELQLGEVIAGRRSHVVFTGRAGNVVGYAGGSQIGEQTHMPLDTASWTSGPLVLGAKANGDNPWRGEIVRVAVFGHFMDAAEVRREWQRFELLHPIANDQALTTQPR